MDFINNHSSLPMQHSMNSRFMQEYTSLKTSKQPSDPKLEDSITHPINTSKSQANNLVNTSLPAVSWIKAESPEFHSGRPEYTQYEHPKPLPYNETIAPQSKRSKIPPIKLNQINWKEVYLAQQHINKFTMGGANYSQSKRVQRPKPYYQSIVNKQKQERGTIKDKTMYLI